ncbi:hypothetical protein HDU86_000720 [Geranomyces michiganensis]|nr:hypothetical protein HDU86_000720 [Geranomyces michiganensis]
MNNVTPPVEEDDQIAPLIPSLPASASVLADISHGVSQHKSHGHWAPALRDGQIRSPGTLQMAEATITGSDVVLAHLMRPTAELCHQIWPADSVHATLAERVLDYMPCREEEREAEVQTAMPPPLVAGPPIRRSARCPAPEAEEGSKRERHEMPVGLYRSSEHDSSGNGYAHDEHDGTEWDHRYTPGSRQKIEIRRAGRHDEAVHGFTPAEEKMAAFAGNRLAALAALAALRPLRYKCKRQLRTSIATADPTLAAYLKGLPKSKTFGKLVELRLKSDD